MYTVLLASCATACSVITNQYQCRVAGTFEGVAHVTSLLDATLSRPLRHCLLRLVEALLLPAAAREDERAARAAAANAAAFVAAGGVQLAVDLVAGMHLAEEPGVPVGGSMWMRTRMYTVKKASLIAPPGRPWLTPPLICRRRQHAAGR